MCATHDHRCGGLSPVAAGNPPSGAAGTFNYLIDLITQVPATRQMYMRRLRTLMDEYFGGKLTSVSHPNCCCLLDIP